MVIAKNTFDDDTISAKIGAAASIITKEGKLHNQHLVEQFRQWESVNLERFGKLARIPKEHLLFYESIAQTLGWMQQSPIEKNEDVEAEQKIPSLLLSYLQVLLEARSGQIQDVGQRLEEIIRETQRSEVDIKRPRRLLGVVAGLETWAQVALPEVVGKGALNMEELQRSSIEFGGRARWTALAPLKMYALYKKMGASTPRSINPPTGRAVSRGIERLLGFTLGESDNDYNISRGLHLKLADLAKASIWDINSGFYRLGGGS